MTFNLDDLPPIEGFGNNDGDGGGFGSGFGDYGGFDDDSNNDSIVESPSDNSVASSGRSFSPPNSINLKPSVLILGFVSGVGAVSLPAFRGVFSAIPLMMLCIPSTILTILSAILPTIISASWIGAVSGVLNLLSLIAIAKTMDIPIDVPQITTALKGIFKIAIEKASNSGDSGGFGGRMSPETKLKFRFRNKKEEEEPEETGFGGGFGRGGGFDIAEEEEYIITGDFIALLLVFLGGYLTSLSQPWSAIMSPLSIGFGIALLQIQENMPAYYLLGASFLGGVAAYRGISWTLPLLLALTIPIQIESDEIEEVVEEVEEIEKTPAEEFRDYVLGRLESEAIKLSALGEKVEVFYYRQFGIQDAYYATIDGNIAPTSLLRRLTQTFGDLEFNVTKREGRSVMMITNDKMEPDDVDPAHFFRLAKEVISTTIFPISVDITDYNKIISIDLEATPHLSNTGTSGSGKSVTIRSAFLAQMAFIPPTELLHVCCDAKAATFSFGTKSLVANVSDLLQILSTIIFMMEESRRRMRLFRGVGVEKLSQYNDAVDEKDRIARVMFLIEEIRYTLLQLENTSIGNNKNPGMITKLGLFDDTMPSPYTAAEKEEIENGIGRTFFKQQKSTQVFESAVGQLMATARSTGVNCVLSTQVPDADTLGSFKGNLSTHIAHRAEKGAAAKIRSFGISDKPIYPWEIPSGKNFLGVHIIYNSNDAGRGCYISPREAVDKYIGDDLERPSLNLAIARDTTLFNDESYERWYRIDKFILNLDLEEGILQNEEQIQEQLDRWYDVDEDGKVKLLAMTQGSEIPPGAMIDMALRISVN